MPSTERIAVKIDVTKIDKKRLFAGKKGTYLDVVLLPKKEGEDEYGNHYVAIQSVSKEESEKGVKGKILGNGRILKPKNHITQAAAAMHNAADARPAKASPIDDDDVPF